MTSHLLHFQTTKKLTQGYCYTRRIPANQAWKFCLFAKLTQMLLQYQSLCLNRWIYQSLISNWNKQASKTYRNTAALGLERLKYLPLFHAFVVYNHFSFFFQGEEKKLHGILKSLPQAYNRLFPKIRRHNQPFSVSIKTCVTIIRPHQ